LVSVIVPHYDRVGLVAETLASIRAQTHPHWETLVIDDGSPAECRRDLERLCESDARVRLLDRGGRPKGANTCRNIGITQSRGSYLLFLDSDDLLAPFALAQRIEAAAASPAAVPVFQIEKFRQVPGDKGTPWSAEEGGDPLARFLRRDSVWHTSGPLWPRVVVERLGGFDEELACWQDVDWHVRALAAGVPFQLRFDLPADCHYRLHHGGTISQRPFAGRMQLGSLVRVFRTAAALPACLATAERREALADMAKGVAFKVLENREFDLYRAVRDDANRLKLFSAALCRRFRLLEAFFRLGGYRIKGTHRLRGRFHRMIVC
jgi:glycosyltransferase involved in cell wall biosynthesis